MKRKLMSAVALTAAALMIVSGCRGADGEGDNTEPIVIGSVNTKSGPATFPEASQAAAAYFDMVNDNGGINGREIQYNALDDKGDPSTAQSSARQLVGQDEAVALVGGASLIECEINASYYEQEDILSMPGIGVDPGCFSTPNIAPTNVGPFNDMTLTLMYGSEELDLDNVCILLEIAGSTRPAYQAGIDKWTEVTGQEPLYIDDTVPYGAPDYKPYLINARDAGCEALAINPVEPDAIAQVNAANELGWDDVTWLYLTSVYSDNFADSVDNAGDGLYVPAEFFPYTEDSEQTEDWRDLMEDNDIPLTAFSQGGYLAAKFFTEVLEGMDGDITRDSVAEALHQMEPIDDPMLGEPYAFGSGDEHPGINCGWPIELDSDSHEWELAGDDWLCIPQE